MLSRYQRGIGRYSGGARTTCSRGLEVQRSYNLSLITDNTGSMVAESELHFSEVAMRSVIPAKRQTFDSDLKSNDYNYQRPQQREINQSNLTWCEYLGLIRLM